MSLADATARSGIPSTTTAAWAANTTRPGWGRASHLTLAILCLLLVMATSLPVSSYSNDQGQVLDNATTCGDAAGCHGPASANATLFIEGPGELRVNQVGLYNITLLGGPGQSYGYYIVVTNSNGISKTITGDPLVHVTSDQGLNVTQDHPQERNHFSFNLTAPKYAGHFIISVAYNSANGDGLNSSADIWKAGTFDLEVVYPHEKVGWDTFNLGLAALVFVAVTTLAFRHLKLKLGV